MFQDVYHLKLKEKGCNQSATTKLMKFAKITFGSDNNEMGINFIKVLSLIKKVNEYEYKSTGKDRLSPQI